MVRGHLKALLAVCLVLITVLGAYAPADAACEDAPKIDISIDNHSHQVDELKSGLNGSHSSESASEMCHNCHLGHCSFTLSPAQAFESRRLPVVHNTLSQFFVLLDFHSNLYRPPIS